MAYIISVLMAGLSFLINKLLLKYIGIQSVISYSPVFEELAKTVFSYYLSADILMTHIVFGVLEGVYDWYNDPNEQRGIKAAMLSMIGHTLFGGVTLIVFSLSGHVFIGILAAVCTHIVWNMMLLQLLV